MFVLIQNNIDMTQFTQTNNTDTNNKQIDKELSTKPYRDSTNLSAIYYKPTSAFVTASWSGTAVGFLAYIIGLWRSDMLLNEKGYYLTLLLFGLFTAITVQKNVRDKLEGIKISDLYYSISWIGLICAITFLVIGLWNATLLPSEKGFFTMAFILSLFSAITVQKNVRDRLL